MADVALSYREQAWAQGLRIKNFVDKTDNWNKTLKLFESGCQLTGCGESLAEVSKAARAVAYVPRSFSKMASATKPLGGPSVGTVPVLNVDAKTVLRVIFFGLSVLYSLRFVSYLHKKGVIDIPDRIATVGSMTSWCGFSVGILGAPLAALSMGRISNLLEADGDRIGGFSRDEWNLEWWVSFWTFGQVGSELAIGLCGMLDIKCPGALTHIARTSSFLKAWIKNPTPPVPGRRRGDEPAAAA